VQLGQVLREQAAFHVVPGTFADAIARVAGAVVRAAVLRAHVRVPRATTGTDGFGENRTAIVRAFESTEVSRQVGLAGYEEARAL